MRWSYRSDLLHLHRQESSGKDHSSQRDKKSNRLHIKRIKIQKRLERFKEIRVSIVAGFKLIGCETRFPGFFDVFNQFGRCVRVAENHGVREIDSHTMEQISVVSYFGKFFRSRELKPSSLSFVMNLSSIGVETLPGMT